ncbi:MAG: hypothetical protein Q8R04_06655 [Nanoarchaeota archaeon]|nr:hypothetical protein [Nanoarchaeota archaeon]
MKNISIEYEKKFQETTGKVVLANETISLKETFQKDREFFEEKYSNLNMENQELKNNNEKLQLKLNSVKSELEDAKAKFDKLYSQFQQVQNSLIKANGQISSLIYKNQELCRKLKEKGGEC